MHVARSTLMFSTLMFGTLKLGLIDLQSAPRFFKPCGSPRVSLRILIQLFYLKADPDPGSLKNVDPDPGQNLK